MKGYAKNYLRVANFGLQMAEGGCKLPHGAMVFHGSHVASFSSPFSIWHTSSSGCVDRWWTTGYYSRKVYFIVEKSKKIFGGTKIENC